MQGRRTDQTVAKTLVQLLTAAGDAALSKCSFQENV